jgi:hypothetical protein
MAKVLRRPEQPGCRSRARAHAQHRRVAPVAGLRHARDALADRACGACKTAGFRPIGMEHLWNRGGRNRSQTFSSPNAHKRLERARNRCHRLPQAAVWIDGKEGDDGSSPSEGSAKAPQNGAFCSLELARLTTCGRYGAAYGAFRSKRPTRRPWFGRTCASMWPHGSGSDLGRAGAWTCSAASVEQRCAAVTRSAKTGHSAEYGTNATAATPAVGIVDLFAGIGCVADEFAAEGFEPAGEKK